MKHAPPLDHMETETEVTPGEAEMIKELDRNLVGENEEGLTPEDEEMFKKLEEDDTDVEAEDGLGA